jgi:cytidylate kinase
MPVIALTQEMGSLAKDVALKLGEQLNLAVMRHEVVEHVADKMHLSKSLISRLREGKAGFLERLSADQRSVALYTAEEVFALAQRGNVVLRGWGATMLLRAVPHVLCVRVTRPFNKRVSWLMEELGTTDREYAEAEVRRSDEAHAARMNHQFGVNWGDPVLYDLVLNTDRLTIDSCVDLIKQALSRPEFAETEQSRAVLANLALEARVRAALRDDPATAETNVTIEANGDRVVLRGIVLDNDEREQVEKVAQRTPGVAAVDNQLRLMAGSRQHVAARKF